VLQAYENHDGEIEAARAGRCPSFIRARRLRGDLANADDLDRTGPIRSRRWSRPSPERASAHMTLSPVTDHTAEHRTIQTLRAANRDARVCGAQGRP